MEICSKGDLKPTKPIFSHKDLASTFRQLCKAVQYLHSLNISHLDLKLENFVKDDQDVIKLIDFEHAQRAERVQQEKGTWLYNSPERKEGNYDGKKADIFSLGICLMGLLVGFIPVSAGNVNFANSQRFLNDNDSFWDGLYTMMQKKHAEFDGFYEQDIELINEMVCQDPNKRPSIDEVLERGFFLLM
jgi:serine/threonine protein kinase